MPRYFEKALWLLTGRTRIPLPSLSNSSLSPLRTPSTRRISRGTVICPLLVIVACFCIVSPHSPYFTTNALLWPARDSGRSRATECIATADSPSAIVLSSRRLTWHTTRTQRASHEHKDSSRELPQSLCCGIKGRISVRSARSTLGWSSPFRWPRQPAKLPPGRGLQCLPAKLSFHRQRSHRHGIALPQPRALVVEESSCDHK